LDLFELNGLLTLRVRAELPLLQVYLVVVYVLKVEGSPCEDVGVAHLTLGKLGHRMLLNQSSLVALAFQDTLLTLVLCDSGNRRLARLASLVATIALR